MALNINWLRKQIKCFKTQQQAIFQPLNSLKTPKHVFKLSITFALINGD